MNPDGCVFIRELGADLDDYGNNKWIASVSRDAVDVDGDGNRDLIAVTHSSGGSSPSPFTLLLGDGLGAFSLTSHEFFSHAASPANSIIFADFDGDNLGDIITGLDDDGDAGSAWFYPPNMCIARNISVALLTIIGLGVATATRASRYEEPSYTVVSQLGEVEIRDYGPRLHAQVSMSGERDRSADSAFRILAGYIFSKDTPSGEAIGMTVPVGQYTDESEDAWNMWFAMPSRFTMETLPPVNDSLITILEQPAQRVAALSFSGRMLFLRAHGHPGLLRSDRGPDRRAR